MEEQKNAGGLLQKAKFIIAEATPKFDEWAAKNGFNHIGIFAPCKTEKTSSEYYFLSKVFGFSAKTIASSVASKDFWNGKLTKAFEWQCFSKDFNEVEPFVDLFDKNSADLINSLYFLPFYNKEEPMYLVIAEFEEDESTNLPDAAETATLLKNIVDFSDNEEMIMSDIDSALDKGLSISHSYLFILSMKNCVEKLFQTSEVERKLSKFDMVDRIEIKSHVLDSINNTAFLKLQPLFCSPNCLHTGSDGEIKIVMFAKDEPDYQIISFHIATSLSDLLGDDATKQILLLTAGICPNKKGTLTFLQKC